MQLAPNPTQEKQVFVVDKGDLQLVQVRRELKCKCPDLKEYLYHVCYSQVIK